VLVDYWWPQPCVVPHRCHLGVNLGEIYRVSVSQPASANLWYSTQPPSRFRPSEHPVPLSGKAGTFQCQDDEPSHGRLMTVPGVAKHLAERRGVRASTESLQARACFAPDWDCRGRVRPDVWRGPEASRAGRVGECARFVSRAAVGHAARCEIRRTRVEEVLDGMRAGTPGSERECVPVVRVVAPQPGDGIERP
jgi:hypothetical protein